MPEPIYPTIPPQSVYQTPPEGSVPLTPPGNPTPSSLPPTFKKPFPKKILMIVGGALLVILLIFLIIKALSGRDQKLGNGEIVWWGLWEEESTVTPLIAEYQQKNPKVKIKYIKQSHQEYRERLVNSFARGEGPDIFRFHNSWVPTLKNDLDNLPASVMSALDFRETFYPVAVSDLTVGADTVGIPLMYDGLALYINEDLFSAAGKVPPANWDNLREIAKELTIKDSEGSITQSGVALGRTENVDHWQEILGLMMLQNKVNFSEVNKCNKNPSSDLDPALENCLGANALEFFTIFSRVDGVWDETLPTSTQAFAAGKVAMYFAPSWRVFEIRQQNPNLNFKTVKVPQVSKREPSDPDIAYATYWVEGVWSRSKNKTEAWNFLKFLSTKESMQKLFFNASKTRRFGELYPRVDMAELLKNDPVTGGFIAGAPDARSWFLADKTFDGQTGINFQINKYFHDAINAVNDRTSALNALEPVAAGVRQVLTPFGLIK